MIHDRRSDLSGYVSGLLCERRDPFTGEQPVGVGHGAFLDAAERLQQRQELLIRGGDSTWSSRRV